MTDSITTQHIPTLESLRARREEIITLAEQSGVRNIRVFGSVARGDPTSDSDVDFLVTVQKGVSVFDLVGLWQDLQDLLGCKVSLITDGIEDTRFLRRIEADVIPL